MKSLPSDLAALFHLRKREIATRLAEFAAVPRAEYFYEFCFCLCTPQSKALHADAVVKHLRANDYLHRPFDATDLLRSPDTYIRFHQTKARRIQLLQQQWLNIDRLLDHNTDPLAVRHAIVQQIQGFGFKEASHALRNIGFRGLAIIDRHLLRMLVLCGTLESIPSSLSVRRYLEIELIFQRYARDVHIDMDELDLLFWSAVTGHVLK